MKTRRILVAGGGSWGTALAHMLAVRGHEVSMLVRSAKTAYAITELHENPAYLRGAALCPSLRAGTDMAVLQSLRPEDILLLSIPCQHVRAWLAAARPFVQPGLMVVNTAKGLELNTLARGSQVLADAWQGLHTRYAMLSGPSFAAEVVRDKPTAVVLACAGQQDGADLRAVFSSACFRCYSSTDVIGVELGGALKNVMAMAAGICDGLGMGSNSRAALMTRGLAELSRIGIACGASALTFMGLSGMGDLVLTCTGDLSRNRQVGVRLGQGESLDAIVASLGMVAEGVKTADAVHALAQELGVDAPVTQAVYHVLHGIRTAKESLAALMARELKAE
jgi:glycerol-3-phosphate dehydrogenase (NAD(P)+)